jgi:REP element-mobilizing transposase RayT
MKYDPARHHRRSIRLRGYDYASQGVYFVTLCTAGRAALFGEVRDGEMVLNPLGEIVCAEWLASADIRREIVLDAFVVMPNHMHGIIAIVDVGADGVRPRSASPSAPRPHSLSTFISGFKSATTRHINAQRMMDGVPIWQRGYFERVVRNERECDAIRAYIAGNPANWQRDKDNLGF